MIAFIAGLSVWSLSGLVSAWFLRRQGHNAVLYAGLGLALGPLIVPIAIRSSRNSEFSTTEVARGVTQGGWVDVLVGLDGDVDDVLSVRVVLDLLGISIRRLRVAVVLDVETGNAPHVFVADDHAAEYLRFAASALGHPDAELVLLSGRPDEALIEHAVEQDMDLVAIGHRRHRVLSGIFGSTSARLARSAQLSVVIGPPADRVLARELDAEAASRIGTIERNEKTNV